MLEALPPLPDAVFRVGGAVLFLGLLYLMFWRLRIGAHAARHGEVKSSIGAPTIFGMPTTETVWRAMKARRRAGDREVFMVRRLGWSLIVLAALLALWPKAG